MKSTALAMALTLCLAPLAPALAQAQPAAAQKAPSDAEVARYAQALLEETYTAQGPGAAVLIARGDRVLFRGARGEGDMEAHTALSPDQLFRIGSVTKQFAAAGVLKLVEEGKVKLDDPVTKYVPGYPNGDKITVLMLLNHTSGIKSYTGIPGHMLTGIQKDLTTAQLIDVFKDQPVDFAPGASWSYNNSGYVLVGAVIESASGMAWYDYLDKVFFKPLGMTDTGYGGDPKLVARQAKGYTELGGKPAPMRILSMTQPHAAGALLSTPNDLLKWNRALHEGRVLKSELYSRMITPEGPAVEADYGLGIGPGKVRGAPTLEHSGGIFGFSSRLTYYPGPDITVVVLQNTDEGPDIGGLARRLGAAALGNPYPAAKPVPVDAATLKAAEGVYRFDEKTTRTLKVTDGQLTAQRTGGRPAVLTPIGKDEFLYADGFNRLTLERDAKGAITGMRFFQLGEDPGVVGARTTEPLPKEPVAVKLSPAALARLTGVYEISPGGPSMTITVEGEAVKAQLTGQSPVNLRPTSATVFEVVEVAASLEFTAGDDPAGQLTLRQNGREMAFKRKP
jgi:D-alanyl-D-alanine carboxypeptidase